MVIIPGCAPNFPIFAGVPTIALVHTASAVPRHYVSWRVVFVLEQSVFFCAIVCSRIDLSRFRCVCVWAVVMMGAPTELESM